MKKIGLIGAGVMGLTVAKQIIDAGNPLFVFDVFPSAVESAGKLGAKPVKSPAELASISDIVILFLPGPNEVAASVSGENGLLMCASEGMIIVDMSTVDPAGTQRLALLLRQKGVGYLDAPVLGRPGTVGKWALPVGGEKEDLEKCKSLFELFAAHVVHIGPSGSGNKIKLLNQLMFGAINAMTAEMMAIAEAMNISPTLLYETITASQAGTVSNLFKELGQRISDDNYKDPTFTVDLLIKDVRLGVEMAKAHNAPPMIARAVESLNEIASAQGYGKDDTSVTWKTYRKIWGMETEVS